MAGGLRRKGDLTQVVTGTSVEVGPDAGRVLADCGETVREARGAGQLQGERLRLDQVGRARE